MAGPGAYQFLLRLRMNDAAELLLDEGLLVRQVAHRMGVADAFQFSRAFKQIHRVAPHRCCNREAMQSLRLRLPDHWLASIQQSTMHASKN